MQAIVIMAQFHTLASFVFGCGFDDADLQWWYSKNNSTTESSYNSNNISDLLLFNKHISSAPPSPPSPNSLNGLLTKSDLNNFDNNLNNETCSLTDSNLIDSSLCNSMDTTNSIESNSIDPTQSMQNNLKLNQNKLNKEQNALNSFHQTQSQANNSLEILMLKMQNISEQKQQQFELDNQEELVKNQSLEIHLTPTQTVNTEFNFNNSPTNSSLTNSGQTNNSSTTTSPSLVASKCLGNDEQNELSKFVIDSKFCYVDFARQRARTDVTTFKVQDYSWNDHGYSLVNRLYSDVGTMLDAKFTTTYNLTYYT